MAELDLSSLVKWLPVKAHLIDISLLVFEDIFCCNLDLARLNFSANLH